MTVGQLIRALRNVDEDTEVLVRTCEGDEVDRTVELTGIEEEDDLLTLVGDLDAVE